MAQNVSSLEDQGFDLRCFKPGGASKRLVVGVKKIKFRVQNTKQKGVEMHTTKLLIGLTLAASIANAQGQAASAAPAGTSTAPVLEAAPSQASKWGAVLAAESAMGIKDSKDNGNAASTETLYTVGAKYKLASDLTVEAQNLFHTRSNLNDLQGSSALIFVDQHQQVRGDFVLKATKKTDMTLAGSSPISLGGRYYFPTASYWSNGSHPIVEANKRFGTIRGDTGVSWDLNPRVTVEMNLSPRITFMKETSSVGSDSLLRMVYGPQATYSFNDTLAAYYAATADTRSVAAQRGTLVADRLDALTHEVGGNITLGALTINPTVSSDIIGQSPLGNESARLFSHETSSYNLNLYANF